MKKLRHIITSSLFIAMMFSFYIPSQAQIVNENSAQVDEYDPIAATLDSLVNLAYIQRLQSNSQVTASPGFQPFDIPTYTPDVYKRRIEKIQTPIPLCYNSQVQQYINMYAFNKRGLTERMMGLSGLYFPMYEEILDQQGIPLEFKYLSIVESALNPFAVSRFGATGLWQFMLGTGKLYKLKINSYIDERRDPVKSTMAACQYFKDMYAIYNDWLLVIAAYNCGAGNVNRAIARSGGKTTFWEISRYLPRETRGYVPAFIAVTYLMNYTKEHNLEPVSPILTYFEADTVMTDQKASLKTIADATNTSLELLTYLNPMYKRGVIPDSDEPLPLRLPTNKINTYIANISKIYRPEESNGQGVFVSLSESETQTADMDQKFHKVKKGEHLLSIANRYKCSVEDIKEWNNIRGNRLVVGQKLTIYTLPNKKPVKLADSTPTKGSNSKLAAEKTIKETSPKINQKNDSKFVWHTVQPGDSLWKIAQAYEGVTVQQIKELNNLQSDNLKVGSKLKVSVNG